MRLTGERLIAAAREARAMIQSARAGACPTCGGRGWVWEPHPKSPHRHQEHCPMGCLPAAEDDDLGALADSRAAGPFVTVRIEDL